MDSLRPDTPMADIVDCCRVWESHREVEIEPRTSADRCPARAICQVTENEPAPAVSLETETLEDIIRKLLPTPALPPPQAVPMLSDRDILIQQLMGAICPPMPVAQERSAVTDHVTELASGRNSHGGGCCFAESVSRFRRRVFFVGGFDPYDGPMPDSR